MWRIVSALISITSWYAAVVMGFAIVVHRFHRNASCNRSTPLGTRTMLNQPSRLSLTVRKRGKEICWSSPFKYEVAEACVLLFLFLCLLTTITIIGFLCNQASRVRCTVGEISDALEKVRRIAYNRNVVWVTFRTIWSLRRVAKFLVVHLH